jgi:hypothetical protein
MVGPLGVAPSLADSESAVRLRTLWTYSALYGQALRICPENSRFKILRVSDYTRARLLY